MLYDFSSPLPDRFRNSVVAIGNFDAVHKGHQALLEVARTHALELNKPFGILTFEPHPRSLFRPHDLPFRVTPIDVKHERLMLSGADFIASLPFTKDTIQIEADDFVRNILQTKLDVHTIICGEDFHFGHNRSGSVINIHAHGIETIVIKAITNLNGTIYSASSVREALGIGNIFEANSILGWDWFIRGIVEHGDERGRTIGYPTANIKLDHIIAPQYGVYAARVNYKDRLYNAAVNIGIRPTFKVNTLQLEAHLFDFSDDLYGQEIDVTIVKKIRNEMKFDSIDILKQQIGTDCDTIKEYLER
jgi:riboflavin kinase/FMN adenylyltransferase